MNHINGNGVGFIVPRPPSFSFLVFEGFRNDPNAMYAHVCFEAFPSFFIFEEEVCGRRYDDEEEEEDVVGVS